MKTRHILFSLFIATLFVACENSLNRIGGSVQPEDDIVNVYVDTFEVTSRTFLTDSVYSRTITAQLGIFDDPMFGEVTADYMAEFYRAEGFMLHDHIVDNKVDSVMFRIFYSSYTGDSLNPMEVSVYELERNLDKSHYTNIDPSDYCDRTRLLCRGFYTAKNNSIPDSIKDYTNNYDFVQMRLPDNFTQRVLNNEVPQVYITNTYGRGTMLTINNTEVAFHFKYRDYLKDQNDEDSIVIRNGSRILPVTKEVLQLNRIKNDIPAKFLIDNDTATFIKTPAGLYTEVTLPVQNIKDKLVGKTINTVKFSIPTFRPYTSTNSTGVPRYLMMVQSSKMNSFFETTLKPDNRTTYVAMLDSTRVSGSSAYVFSYNFNNIAPYINDLIKRNDIEDGVKIALVPVEATVDAESGIISRVRNLLHPTSIMLKKGQERGKVTVIYSEY